jgi:hypothetical protein
MQRRIGRCGIAAPQEFEREAANDIETLIWAPFLLGPA